MSEILVLYTDEVEAKEGLVFGKTLKDSLNLAFTQDKEYNAKKFVAKKDLKESAAGNLTITKNDKTYELLGVNSKINADKIQGVIGVEHIHPAALERVVVRENQAARFALTENDIQLGDVVKENDTGKMYFVVDVTNLNNANGYMEFAVGTAADVSWENVSGKPNLSEVGHTHSGSDITSAVDNATNAVNATNASNVPWTGVSNKPALAASLSISGSTLALKDSEGVSMSSVTLPEASGSGSSAEIDFSDFRSDVVDFQSQMETVRLAALNKEEEERTDEDWDAIYGTTNIVSGDDIRSALVKINWMLWERPSNNDLNEIYRSVYPDELKYNMFNIGDAPEDGVAENWIVDLQALKAFREVYDSLVVTREGFAKESANDDNGTIRWQDGTYAYNIKYRETDRHYNEKWGTWEEATYINVLTDMSPLNAAHLQGTIPSECMPSDIAEPVIWTAYSNDDGKTLTLGVTNDRSYTVLTNECTLSADALVGTVPVASLPSSVLTNTSSLDATKLTGTIPVANLPQEALASGGGSATLSAAGSEYQPVYINNSGVPTACGFKIMQVSSLPANPDQDTLYIVTGA